MRIILANKNCDDTINENTKYTKRNIYVTMKTICPPGYNHNGFMATHAPGHMMYVDIVVIIGRAHCFHDYIYITPILLL